MNNADAAALLESLARDDNAGWVEVPGIGLVGLQGQAAKLLARRDDGDEWTDEAVRFWCAVTWAGSKKWLADPRVAKVIKEMDDAVRWS